MCHGIRASAVSLCLPADRWTCQPPLMNGQARKTACSRLCLDKVGPLSPFARVPRCGCPPSRTAEPEGSNVLVTARAECQPDRTRHSQTFEEGADLRRLRL